MRSIESVTPEGHAAVALAREVASSLIETAGRRDSDAVFDKGAVEEVAATGLTAATSPADLGGGGVTMSSDVMAIAAALARGDGSIALTVNMHLGAAGSLVGLRDNPGAEELSRGVASGEVFISAAVTESGTNFFHPRATLEKLDDDWLLSGAKAFATGSPMASHLVTNAGICGGEADGRLATLFVSVATPGVRVTDDWDGLGMRASCSGQVAFSDVFLPADAIVLPAGLVGEFSSGALIGRLMGNVGNLAAMCGLAEAAYLVVVDRLTKESRVSNDALATRATVRQSFGDLQTELYLCQATLRDLGRRCDELTMEPPVDLAAAHAAMAEYQAAKVVTNQAAIGVVDRAMDLVGGSGYGGGHELAQIYRDVRAGPFMQPFTRHEGIGYIGAVGLGVEPDPEA